MRGDDRKQEPASPTDALGRIWEATRPVGPSMDALDALWARASVELDGLEASARLKSARPARRRRLMMVGFIAAQAAVVLLAALVLIPRGGREPVEVALKTPVMLDLDVPFDSVMVVRIPEGASPQVETQASPALPLLTPHDEFDGLEAGASSWDMTVQ